MRREQTAEGVPLAISSGGGILVESKKQDSPELISQGGWNLSWLLRLLGSPPFLSVEQPVRFEGLPEGSYTISLDGTSVTVTVRAGELAGARLGS